MITVFSRLHGVAILTQVYARFVLTAAAPKITRRRGVGPAAETPVYFRREFPRGDATGTRARLVVR